MSRRKHSKTNVLETKSSSSLPVNRITLPLEQVQKEAQLQEPDDPVLRRAMQHADQGQYARALEILKLGASSRAIMNARGVCLLRMGRPEDAIHVYRGLVLDSGRIFPRKDAPVLYVVNFATALFLNGSPSGCLSLISQLDEKQHPGVKRLRDAVRSWVRSLTFWQKLNWWCGEIEPHPCRPSLDYPAGDFTEWSPEVVSPAAPESADSALTTGSPS